MDIIHFFLDFYFAFVLGIAGIAKVDSPHLFISALRFQYKLSPWYSRAIGKIWPWIEIAISMSLLLTTMIYKMAITVCIFLLFLFFLIFHLVTYIRGYAVDCGCYGRGGHPHQRNANLGTLLLQVILAALLVTVALCTSPLSWAYYLFGSVIVMVIYSCLLWKTWQRHYRSVIAKNEAYSSTKKSALLFMSSKRGESL